MKFAWLERSECLLNRHAAVVPGLVVICGLLWRLHYASDFYLNPDEALHYTVATNCWHGLVGFYCNATHVVHPPLFIPVLQAVSLFGRSEWLLRLVPITAGALFPLFIMLWMQRIVTNAAALSAQLVLTFSPALINLSTEVRAYSLAFLFLSICMLSLEEALNQGSTRYMIWFVVFLYLAILTEYSVAWFVASLGIYALLRLHRTPKSSAVRATWAFGQVGAFSIYAFLYLTHISRYSHAGLEGMYTTWLQPAFPQPHENFLLFALKGTYRQFIYLFQIRLLAWVAAIGFFLGLLKIWRDKSHAHAILLLLPFGIACLAAIFYLFPYGETRHTAILGIAIAAGLGCSVATLTKNRMLPILLFAVPIIFIWNAASPDSSLTIPRERRHISSMREAVDFLHTRVPAGSAVLTDEGTDLTLGYYLGCPDYGYYSVEIYRMRQCARLQIVVAPTFQFSGMEDLRASFSKAKAKYNFVEPVWIAAGGFFINVANPASESRPFGKTMAIFNDTESSIGPGYPEEHGHEPPPRSVVRPD